MSLVKLVIGYPCLSNVRRLRNLSFLVDTVLTSYSGDWRVNEFFFFSLYFSGFSLSSLSFPDPPASHPQSHHVPGWLWKKGLKLPTGHPFSQPSSRPPGQKGACLLSLGHKIQSGARTGDLSDLCTGKKEEKQEPCPFDRLHLCLLEEGSSLIFKIRCHSGEQCAELIRLIERPWIVLIEPISFSCHRQIVQTAYR